MQLHICRHVIIAHQLEAPFCVYNFFNILLFFNILRKPMTNLNQNHIFFKREHYVPSTTSKKIKKKTVLNKRGEISIILGT